MSVSSLDFYNTENLQDRRCELCRKVSNKALARVASFLVERDFFRFLTARKLKRRQKHRPTISNSSNFLALAPISRD